MAFPYQYAEIQNFSLNKASPDSSFMHPSPEQLILFSFLAFFIKEQKNSHDLSSVFKAHTTPVGL